MEIPVMSALVTKPKGEVPAALVAQCSNYRDAVALCIQFGHFTQQQIAGRLGIDQGTFSHILRRGGSEKRRRYLDPDMFEAIEGICGNRAITQYFEMQSRGQLNRQNKTARIAALKRELAEAEMLEAG